MLEKDPEKRISLTNILTHKFVIKHYNASEESKSNQNEEIKKNSSTKEINKKSMEKNKDEKNIRKKHWKKSLTHQNDSLGYSDNEGAANKINNDFNPKFTKQMQQAKSTKSFHGNANLMPPSNYEYSRFGSNKMLFSMNDSNLLDALENREQLKSVGD